MAELIDISVLLHEGMPVWPGSAGFRLVRTMELARGENANVSKLECDLHVGTHVDAPWHFVPDGSTVESLPLDVLVGEATVVDLPGIDAIDADTLEDAAIDPAATRVLLRTRNSELWAAGAPGFRQDFVALTADGAEWIVERGIRLVGIDYLSVQRFGDPNRTHEILLGDEVVVVEGLDLHDAAPGRYELLCLPLKLDGAEGAPARALLRTLRPAAGRSTRGY